MSTTLAEANVRAKELTARLTDKQLAELYKLADSGKRLNADIYQTWVWIRSEFIDRGTCPDCRTTIDDEMNCQGCPS